MSQPTDDIMPCGHHRTCLEEMSASLSGDGTRPRISGKGCGYCVALAERDGAQAQLAMTSVSVDRVKVHAHLTDAAAFLLRFAAGQGARTEDELDRSNAAAVVVRQLRDWIKDLAR